MLANPQRSFRFLAAMGVLALTVLAFDGGDVISAAEKEQPTQKGKQSQTAKKSNPKKEAARGTSGSPGTKPPECTGDFPKIQKVQPDEGKAGTKVTITGKNFGQRGCLSMVSFGPGSPSKFDHKDDMTITATVPEAKKGLRLLTVNTAAGQDSKPFLVR